MKSKRNTYRASRHVRLGVPDEHAHNMFLSVLEQCCRLGLWAEHIHWTKAQNAFQRLTHQMRIGNIQRKRDVQTYLDENKKA